MIKYFCNRCEKELGPERGQPYIRYERDFMASVLIMHNGIAEKDICHACIQQIITTGEINPPADQAPTEQPKGPPIAVVEPEVFVPSRPKQ